ncbi:predicted protein [Nematostella vectensis]|uniref:Caprin-1 dimerization domain-containing protein n=1 Tax=Nematostella vectensis TaxID=45351 RepID=A7SK30_NEMVE|nr:predicted protein [Nematostella vectensis]|eukprot:XP_001627983.1 predicted protein [Nematostella vectensis]
MPSASSKPSDSQALMDSSDIAKSGLLLVEKKVRNLEKRKLKLDGYKKQMDSGQELNADQKNTNGDLTLSMPSASSKPSDSQALMDSSDIAKSGLLLVEKKVRNLEKRKLKLDGYKKQMDSGQELNADQKAAIANLDVVEMNLDMAKDLLKQFQQMHSEVVTEDQFVQIDEFYKLITPDEESDVPVAKQLRTASEHIVKLLDHNNSAVVGTTYKDLCQMIENIKKCGYFESGKTAPEDEPAPVQKPQESSGESTPNGDLSGSAEDLSQVDQQAEAEQKEPAQAEVAAPVVQPAPVQPPVDDVSSFTANEHGLNFLVESEVEAKAGEAGGQAQAPSGSEWAEQPNGDHNGSHAEEEGSNDGFTQMRGGGRGGFRGNRGGFRGGNERGQRRGGRGGHGPPRGGGGFSGPRGGGQQQDGYRRGGGSAGRGGRGGGPRGVPRGGGGGRRGGGAPPQQ